MKFKLIDEHPRTFVVIFDTGDEVAEGLKEFARQQNISAASFKAIGALSSVDLGWFNWETKKYEPSVQLSEQVELLSLIGDVALQDEKPAVHAHAIVGPCHSRKEGWKSLWRAFAFGVGPPKL